MARQKAKTRKDDLRTGTPFWVKTPNSTVAAQVALTRDRFDVIVVGAGISGALVAEALTRAGKSVLILDRRSAVRGSIEAGVSAPVGSRWFRSSGGMPPTHLAPSAPQSTSRNLSLAEREEIALECVRRAGVRAVARKLGRSPSTTSREIRRNSATRSGDLDYRAITAQCLPVGFDAVEVDHDGGNQSMMETRYRNPRRIGK